MNAGMMKALHTKTHKPTYLVYDSTTSASYHFADEGDSKSNFTLLFFFGSRMGWWGGGGGGGGGVRVRYITGTHVEPF